MKSLPMADDAGGGPIALRNRYRAHIEQQFPPRRYERRQIGLLVGLAFAMVVGAATGFRLIPPYAAIAGGLIGVYCGWGLLRTGRGEREIRRLRRLTERGAPVVGFLVRADAALYKPGRDAQTCRVLISFQPEVSGEIDYMRTLARRVARLRDEVAALPEERLLVAQIRDAHLHRDRRRRLPYSLTDGSTVYCADLEVRREYLPQPFLTTEVDMLPCFAEAGDGGSIELIPTWVLQQGNPIPVPPRSRTRR